MDTCGIVIAGGGARGAYEAGALSVLLPALETEGVTPTIFVGTSAGAINATAFAALINYGATEASRRVLEVWRMIRPHRIYEPIAWGLARGRWSPAGTCSTGAPRPSIGLLDPAPLRRILDAEVPWGQIRQNLRHPELLAAVAVAATDERDYRTRMFVAQDPARALPPADPVRNLDYRDAELSTTHVLASSALPVVIPAVSIDDPDGTPAWYADGGVRLNAPLRPGPRPWGPSAWWWSPPRRWPRRPRPRRRRRVCRPGWARSCTPSWSTGWSRTSVGCTTGTKPRPTGAGSSAGSPSCSPDRRPPTPWPSS